MVKNDKYCPVNTVPRNDQFLPSIKVCQQLFQSKMNNYKNKQLNNSSENIKMKEIVTFASSLENYLDLSREKRMKNVVKFLTPGSILYGKIINFNESLIKFSLLKIKNYPNKWIDDLDLMFYVTIQEFFTKKLGKLLIGDIYSATIIHLNEMLKCSLNELIIEPVDQIFPKISFKKESSFLEEIIQSEEFYNLKTPYDLCDGMKFDYTKFDSLFSKPPRTKFKEDEYYDALRFKQYCKWSENLTERAVKFIREGRSNDASKLLEQSLQLNPKNVETHVAKGALLANNGNLKDAIEYFKKAILLKSNHRNANEYLVSTSRKYVQTLLKNNQLNEALEIFHSVQSTLYSPDVQIEKELNDIKKILNSTVINQKLDNNDKERILKEANSMTIENKQTTSDSTSMNAQQLNDSSENIHSTSLNSTHSFIKTYSNKIPNFDNPLILMESKKLKRTGKLEHLADDELQFVANLLSKNN